ncbi:GntR family transcriptional regulator [Micromonospora sp. NBC_01412]|uniref:GntR family transcriptional regulator n=1 Tax=Micromonospora sp. NBC_01412 TaxID=2903590 RepID=UPI00324939C5
MASKAKRSGALPPKLNGGPKGVQLQEILEAHIASLEPGAPLPSERDLVKLYGVARMTVRVEIERLARRRLVYRQQGRGTFVAERPFTHTEHLSSFTELIQARGFKAGARLLDLDTIQAVGSLAVRMEVPAGTDVLRVRRVRTADKVPLAVEESHLIADRFPGLAAEDLQTRSLYGILADRYGVQVAEGMQRLQAVILDPTEAALLETEPGEPALRGERIARDAEGVVVEFVGGLYRGDRYEVVLQSHGLSPL